MTKQFYLKLKESFISVIPIVLLVVILNFTPLVNLSFAEIIIFLVASAIIILGIALFSFGADMSMTPIGERVGSIITKSKNLFIIILIIIILAIFSFTLKEDRQLNKFESLVKDTVTSPTFNILKCYKGEEYEFYHIDAYRLEGVKQDLGLEEFIEGDGVCLVEWSEYLEYLLPEEYLKLEITIEDNEVRIVKVSGVGDRYRFIEKEIERLW